MINLGLLNQHEYSLKDEAGSVKALGMDYIHIPVIFERPQRHNLIDFFSSLEANKGKKGLCALRHEYARVHLYRALQRHPPEAAASNRRLRPCAASGNRT